MFSERISGIYTSLEEKYYSLLDFLDGKGIPVYAYNDFLEEKGLPAFPITVALLVLLVAGAYGLLFVGSAVNTEITISFSDQFEESVSGVTVTVKDSSGNLVASPQKVANGGSITLQGIPLGTELALVAEKDGFKQAEQAVSVTKERLSAAISMERKIEAIVGKIQLVDSETGDPIRNAVVTAEWMGQTKSETTDSEGKASFAGIPANMDVLVRVQADGYETLTGNYSFLDEELKGISLVASSASFAGMSKLVVSVLDEEGSPVKGPKVIVWDRETDTSVEERTIEGSEIVFSIPKGTSARLIVQKEGFLKYDSLDYDESRTMRQDEELWSVVLEKGGTRLVVTVFAGQTPLGDAAVQLFDLNGNLLGREVTGFGGTVEFTGLSPEQFYVTAYKQGFLPAREKANVAETEIMSLVVESADSANSSYLGISVLDSYKAMANNADLSFSEKVAGQLFPLGIPSLKTDVSGYASIVVKTGTLAVVEAQLDMQIGLGEKLVEANKDNQMVIELSKPIDVIELQVLDSEGNAAAGHVVIESVAGELLFDGPISEGRIFFDSEGNNEAVVKVETTDGETFSQRILVEGRETMQVNLGEAAVGIAPTITFTGVFDQFGEEAEGITPGENYWLGFQTTWPSGVEKGGVHVRIGQDGVAFVDSQQAGIMGFEATASSYFYGKSYQPLPSPGNETADKQNVGIAGQLNKLVELYFEQPENTVVARVRVKANELISAGEIEVHYRAWSEAGGKFFRTPLDSELGEELFSGTKTSLYAADEKAIVKVFASGARCEEQLCGNYFFIMPNGLHVERQLFKAVTEEVYALEIDLSAKKPLNVELKLDTDKASPKIQFTGYDVDNFVDQQEEAVPAGADLSGQGYFEWGSGSEEAQSSENPLGFKQQGEISSITVTGLGVSPERSRKVRIYFRAVAEGKAEIKMQAASESVLNENFVFEVERNKPLMVTVSPREIEIGEPFTVKVLDAEDGTAVQDATVQVRNLKGNIVASISGTGSTREGLLGEYKFKNSLQPGFYNLVVSVAGYKGFETEFAIARHDLLSVIGPFTIDIPEGSRETTYSFSMHNDAGQEVTGIEGGLERDASFPQEFAVSVVNLPESVSKDQDVTGTIRVIVNLNDQSEDSLYGEATLVVGGMAAGNYLTKSEVRVKISYNKPLKEECLYFDKQYLVARINGRQGSSATDEFEVENRCEATLSLRATVEEKQLDPGIRVSVQDLRIEDGEKKTVKVSVSNTIERMYDQRRHFTILFESSQIAKTIPLTVELVNPIANLSYPPSIALWMVRSAAEERAYAQAPMHVVNMGAEQITAFGAITRAEQHAQGITVGIEPTAIGGLTLLPGKGLEPQRFVYARTDRTEAMPRPGQGYVQFSGIVGRRQQPNLGSISLSFNYSGIKCLEAKPVEDMYFSSKEAGQGTLERAIIVKNNCGEPVRLSGSLKPAKVSGNTFVLSPPITLNPGQQREVKLILMKSQETNRVATVKVLGLLTMQNKWIESNEIQVTLKLGQHEATAEGKHTAEISIKECDSDTSKRIAFPILSSDCGNGYCDAKQLSEYLVEKMDNLVKTAEDKANRASRNAEKFGNCADKSYCRFERDMGIIGERFPVFMQLDFMTEQVLGKALEESKELKGYMVLQGAKSVEDIGEAGFDFGEVHIGGQFKGCGKYNVTIVGAIRVENAEIMVGDKRNFMLSVNLEPRADTDECWHRVENVANFLPVDEGFTILQNYLAWPGFVKARPEFKELGEALAKELFGKAEGRHSSSIAANSNKLEIVKGDTKGGLLKIRIDRTGEPDSPKTIYLHVPISYSKEDKQMTAELAKAFKSFKANSLGDDACWGEDDEGQFIVMKSYKDIDKLYGKLQIQGMQSIRINNQLQCIDLNISSKAPENVTFTTDFSKKPSKTGIEYIIIKVVKEGKDNELLEEKALDSKPKKSEELQLEEEKGRPGIYSAAFKFCVKGDNMFPLAVENIKSIGITGHGIANRNTEPHKVAVEACGIHPIELVKKMAEVSAEELKAPQVYYATVGWQGSPSDTIKLSDLRIALAAQIAREKANNEQYVAGEGVPEGQQQVVKTRLANDTMKGIGSYFIGCAGATAGVNWLVPTKLIADILFNCAPTSVMAAKRTARNYGVSAEETIDIIDKYTKPLLPVVAVLSFFRGGAAGLQTTAIGTPFFLDAMGDKETEKTLQELEEAKSDFAANMLNSGLYGGQLAKAVHLGEKSMWVVTESNAKILAEAAAEQVKMSDDFGLAGKTVMNQLKKNLEKNFKTAAIDSPGTTVADVFDDVATKSTSELAADVADDFIGKFGRNADGSFRSTAGTKLGKEYTRASTKAAREVLTAEGLSTENFKNMAMQRANAHPNLPTPPASLASKPFNPGMIRGGDLTTAFSDYEKSMKGFADYDTKAMNKYRADWRKTWDIEYRTALKEAQDESFNRIQTSLQELDVDVTKPRVKSMIRASVKDSANEADAIKNLRSKKLIRGLVVEATEKKKEVVDAVLKKSGAYDDFGKMKKFSQIKGATLKNKIANVKTAFRANWKTMSKNIGLGIASGFIAQIGGWVAWDIYWNHIAEKGPGDEGRVTIGGKEFPSDRVLLARPIINLTELTNFTTYRIKVGKSTTGRIEFEFNPVKYDDDEAVKEMEDYLRSNPKMEWRGDCKKFGRIPAPKILGTCSEALIPDEGDGITIAMWKAYYDNDEIIYGISKSLSVPQHQIMAVVATNPTEILPNMPPNWYLYDEDERKGWLSEIGLLIKGKGIENIYSSRDSKSILDKKLAIWEKTKCDVKIGA